MSEEEYKSVIATYQQKAFELFNSNIVLESQLQSQRSIIEKLNREIESISFELKTLRELREKGEQQIKTPPKTQKTQKSTNEF